MPAALPPEFTQVKLIGQGGMGSVYRAQRGAQTVAVKVLTAFRDTQHRQRFEREARALAQVDSHPHIVRIHNLKLDTHNPYFVLEYIDGPSLSEFLESGASLSLEDSLTLIHKMADALAFIHAQGFVHRDVKPSNILLRKTTLEPVLSDFGLVHGQTMDSLTVTGDVIGTPGYMAPEQVAGDKSTAAADVWALGCILYELCTGSQAFESSGTQALLLKIAAATPIRPSRLDASFPKELETLILSMIAKDPAARPTAKQISEHCQSLLKQGLKARRPWLQRLSSGALIGLLGVAIAAWAWQSYSRNQRLKQWRRELRQHTTKLQTTREPLTTALAEFVRNQLLERKLRAPVAQRLADGVPQLERQAELMRTWLEHSKAESALNTKDREQSQKWQQRLRQSWQIDAVRLYKNPEWNGQGAGSQLFQCFHKLQTQQFDQALQSLKNSKQPLETLIEALCHLHKKSLTAALDSTLKLPEDQLYLPARDFLLDRIYHQQALRQLNAQKPKLNALQKLRKIRQRLPRKDRQRRWQAFFQKLGRDSQAASPTQQQAILKILEHCAKSNKDTHCQALHLMVAESRLKSLPPHPPNRNAGSHLFEVLTQALEQLDQAWRFDSSLRCPESLSSQWLESLL